MVIMYRRSADGTPSSGFVFVDGVGKARNLNT